MHAAQQVGKQVAPIRRRFGQRCGRLGQVIVSRQELSSF
jgi:hypothetical protein